MRTLRVFRVELHDGRVTRVEAELYRRSPDGFTDFIDLGACAELFRTSTSYCTTEIRSIEDVGVVEELHHRVADLDWISGQADARRVIERLGRAN